MYVEARYQIRYMAGDPASIYLVPYVMYEEGGEGEGHHMYGPKTRQKAMKRRIVDYVSEDLTMYPKICWVALRDAMGVKPAIQRQNLQTRQTGSHPVCLPAFRKCSDQHLEDVEHRPIALVCLSA